MATKRAPLFPCHCSLLTSYGQPFCHQLSWGGQGSCQGQGHHPVLQTLGARRVLGTRQRGHQLLSLDLRPFTNHTSPPKAS